MRRILILLFLTPACAPESPSHWAAKLDPGEIYANIFAESDCPVSQAELVELVNEAMSNFRLKRSSKWNQDEVNLDIALWCGVHEGGGWSYAYRVMLSKYRLVDGDPFQITFSPDFYEHRFGLGDGATISSGLDSEIEVVLKKYLAVNSD